MLGNTEAGSDSPYTECTQIFNNCFVIAGNKTVYTIARNVVMHEVALMLNIYRACPDASTIIQSSRYQAMRLSKRHGCTNTYDHSIRVAELALMFSTVFFCDRIKAIHAALLHDMADSEERKSFGEKCHYMMLHPQEAAVNAARLYGMGDEECAAIRTHMFPLSSSMPHGRIALSVILADKFVSIYEVSIMHLMLQARMVRVSHVRGR